MAVFFDDSGNLLWHERYIFSRIHGKGERFFRDSVNYKVMDSAVTRGKFGGAIVEHVVVATS